ncbi:MAG: hypothetical protein A2176_05440 [Spirochaetes bacterium RBG_13_51_14]|nr:MAG: hypothetical protein A2176_05440 [Spirochaetes bacterium RBG_13_51_14]
MEIAHLNHFSISSPIFTNRKKKYCQLFRNQKFLIFQLRKNGTTMRRYNPIFYYLALANFLFFLGNSLYILLPIFLKNMGASESYIGVMNNIDKVFTIVTAVTIGSFMHGRDRIRILRFGYLILAIAYSSYLLISSLTWLILLIRIVHGIGFSIAMILGTTIIFDVVPLEDAAEAIGVYGITGALSNALSPFFGELLLSRGYSHYLIFFLSAALVTMSIAITYMIPRMDLHARNPVEPATRGSLHLLKNTRYLLMAISTIIFGGGFGVIITYLPNFIRTTTDYKYSYFFLIYIGVLILIRITFMRIVNRINRNVLIAAAFAAGALMNIFLNALDTICMLFTVSIMYGITHGILYPVLNATMVSLVPQKDRGTANALFTACFNGGMMLFALTLGMLIDYSNTYLVAFNVCAAAFIIAIGVIIALTLRYGSLDIKVDAALSID